MAYAFARRGVLPALRIHRLPPHCPRPVIVATGRGAALLVRTPQSSGRV